MNFGLLISLCLCLGLNVYVNPFKICLLFGYWLRSALLCLFYLQGEVSFANSVQSSLQIALAGSLSLSLYLLWINGEYSVKSSHVLSGLLGSHGVFAFLCAQLYVICRLAWILHMLMLKSYWLVCFPNLTQMVCLVLSVTFCIFKLADVLFNKEFGDWLESL